MLKFSYAVAALALAARVAEADDGTVVVYKGVKPAKCEDAAAGTLCVTLALNPTAFGAPANVGGNAVSTANTIVGAACVADGPPDYFRVLASDDTVLWQGDVGDDLSSADLKFPNLDWNTGDTINVSSMTVKEWGQSDPS